MKKLTVAILAISFTTSSISAYAGNDPKNKDLMGSTASDSTTTAVSMSMIGIHIHKDDKREIPPQLQGKRVREWTDKAIADFIDSV